MLIRIIIAVFLAVPAYFLVMRYNLHMFQLNGYKNGEFVHWLKKNIRQQWLVLWAGAVGILRLLFPWLFFDIVEYLTLLLMIAVYNAMKRLRTKKRLVYTARVKRLIVSDVILTGILVFFAVMVLGYPALPGIAVFAVSLQIIMLPVSNIVNHPVEQAVNRYYIRDAEKKLKSVPGLTIIGVTGSYGKTSVKFYLQTLLQEKYNVLVTPESYNTPMGVVKTIRSSLKPTHEIFICEMGARHVGDIKEICDIVHPHHGVITSIGPQHLETFFNMDNIMDTKFELADALPKGGMLFLNGDNAYIRQKAPAYENEVFYCVCGQKDGMERTDDAVQVQNGYFAKDIAVSQLGTDFTIVAPDGTSELFQMRLIGAHNVINVAGAIAVANQMGIPLSRLKIPVRRIQPVEHRMQMREHGLVTIIDDAYNSNPVGSKAAVETLALFEGIKILVTPGMVELGEKEAEYNEQFGGYAAACCDYILLVGKKRTEPIMEGARKQGFPMEKCLAFDKLEEAVSYAYAIKGKGHKYILLENDLPDQY